MEIKHNYDEITIVPQGQTDIEYGIIHGNNTIVFIKVGMKGGIYGYENKYLRIACNLHEKHSCTVIVSSNPNGYNDDFSDEMSLLKNYAEEYNLQNYRVYYLGHSNGGALGVIHAYKYPEIKKVVCINGPLMINRHHLNRGISNFNGEKIHLVYGSKDPSLWYLQLFTSFEGDRMLITKIDGADHNFTGFLDLFMALPGYFFFGDNFDDKLLNQ